eukprot:c11299_g1_i1.p1 GENE.c11299_g1_i1~~c11299_g1_i1.p1  ORF type:complete len:123 (-),score=40.28 c11299_g1_i1:24-365(-)
MQKTEFAIFVDSESSEVPIRPIAQPQLQSTLPTILEESESIHSSVFSSSIKSSVSSNAASRVGFGSSSSEGSGRTAKIVNPFESSRNLEKEKEKYRNTNTSLGWWLKRQRCHR